jgi:hypothetical protein
MLFPMILRIGCYLNKARRGVHVSDACLVSGWRTRRKLTELLNRMCFIGTYCGHLR